jgi:hypothetical protein
MIYLLPGPDMFCVKTYRDIHFEKNSAMQIELYGTMTGCQASGKND